MTSLAIFAFTILVMRMLAPRAKYPDLYKHIGKQFKLRAITHDSAVFENEDGTLIIPRRKDD